MMRVLLAALLFCALLTFVSTPAKAFWINDRGSGQAQRIFGHHGAHRGHLSAECRHAASLGGPCGCWASEYVFGRSIRTLWLARAWLLRFARTQARPGVVAVWPHHVAPVVEVLGHFLIVADSWATHRVRSPGVFVDPHVIRTSRL